MIKVIGSSGVVHFGGGVVVASLAEATVVVSVEVQRGPVEAMVVVVVEGVAV